VLWFARYDAWLTLDHVTQQSHLVGDDRAACERLRRKFMTAAPATRATTTEMRCSDVTAHGKAIEVALDQISRGNLYQVNLARSFSTELKGDSLALWLAMRAQGGVPLGAYLDAGDHQVLSRSMELFLDWDRGTRVLETRPIKGTIARSGTSDDLEANSLRNDGKERAEHTMIVDLMRNDLGRVAEVGSVQPAEVMRVEPYAGLSHLVSTIRCTTRRDVDLAAIFGATFPPGSVTGTPKLAAIKWIETLETEPRGVYTGAIGHIDHAGGCHFAVAIRTAVVRGGSARYFAGGGIVEGSRVAREIDETELKARVFAAAIEAIAAPEATVTTPDFGL
jgi:para-aminobenzoate synthetase component 1